MCASPLRYQPGSRADSRQPRDRQKKMHRRIHVLVLFDCQADVPLVASGSSYLRMQVNVIKATPCTTWPESTGPGK